MDRPLRTGSRFRHWIAIGSFLKSARPAPGARRLGDSPTRGRAFARCGHGRSPAGPANRSTSRVRWERGTPGIEPNRDRRDREEDTDRHVQSRPRQNLHHPARGTGAQAAMRCGATPVEAGSTSPARFIAWAVRRPPSGPAAPRLEHSWPGCSMRSRRLMSRPKSPERPGRTWSFTTRPRIASSVSHCPKQRSPNARSTASAIGGSAPMPSSSSPAAVCRPACLITHLPV
jgi:hypothetical protein